MIVDDETIIAVLQQTKAEVDAGHVHDFGTGTIGRARECTAADIVEVYVIRSYDRTMTRFTPHWLTAVEFACDVARAAWLRSVH